MDDFKPEDELKPDTSDRRPVRSRKTSSAPKVPVSRQQMMMGVGVLVLLLIVIGIGSTLTSSGDGDKKAAQAPTSADSNKNIDLSGSASMSGQNNAPQADAAAPATANAPQELSAPPVSSTPTEAQPVQTPAGQQRVELPGDLNSALSGQQNLPDATGSGQQSSSLPLAPATVAGGATASKPAPQPAPARQHSAAPVQQSKPTIAHKPAATKPAAKESHSAPAKAAPAATGGNYTLQLSSASRPDTLNAWAKKQNLSGYHVYKTTRNGQPWYVLVSGAYATPAEAKRAVASLPAEVRAKSPWVKPVSQVKKESTD
ncbi:SPOR domain-containing protein [Erwinia sp. CGal63]|uniref:SPOR domain-containing protein n=1 Tax=Erwinia sp. CGal63 TaxID=2919889 RepID=UPI003008DF87